MDENLHTVILQKNVTDSQSSAENSIFNFGCHDAVSISHAMNILTPLG